LSILFVFCLPGSEPSEQWLGHITTLSVLQATDNLFVVDVLSLCDLVSQFP
jgi:hypothetical protein